jgi:hypothetical protein
MARKKNDEEVTRVLAMLRDAVRYSNLSNREVERRLGYSANSGYLSRLFAADRELKFRQIVDILEIVGLPPANFFRAVFGEPDDSTEALRLERILQHAHPPGGVQEQPEEGPVPLTEEQVEELMKRMIRKVLFSDDLPPNLKQPKKK